MKISMTLDPITAAGLTWLAENDAKERKPGEIAKEIVAREIARRAYDAIPREVLDRVEAALDDAIPW